MVWLNYYESFKNKLDLLIFEIMIHIVCLYQRILQILELVQIGISWSWSLRTWELVTLHKKPVRKDDEEEEGGDCGDQEESPEKPAVNSLGKHFPLSADVVVSRLRKQFGFQLRFQKKQILGISSFCLQVFLFQETLYYSHQIVLFSLQAFNSQEER